MNTQDKASTPDRLPQIVEDYIVMVVKRMRYRRVRNDVQAELRCHFEDALADCQTDQERQETARQIIETFGDTRLLARLIRRAKKRCRPLWVKIMIRGAQVCGVLLLYFALSMSRLYIGQPVIKFHLVQRLNETMRQGRAETLNARHEIEEAIERLPDSPTHLTSIPFADMNEVQKEALLTYLKACEPSLDLLRQGVEKPFYWGHYEPVDPNKPHPVSDSQNQDEVLSTFELTTRLTDDLMPKLRMHRQLAFTMGYQIESDCEQGYGEQALSDSLVLVRFGRHLCGSGLVIEEMVGAAITGLGIGKINNVLTEVDIDRQTLTTVQQILQEILDGDEPWLTFQYEKALIDDLIQKGFTDDGQGNGRPLANGLLLAAKSPADWWRGLLLFDYPDRKEVTQRIDMLYETMDSRANQVTPWELRDGSGQLQVPTDLMTGITSPAFERVAQLSWRMKTRMQATCAILAIKLYEKTNGRLPSDLNDLVEAGILDTLPRDYYSDGPLGYDLTAEGFILYSRGQDLKDDNGTPSTDENGKLRRYGSHGDWIFWPLDVYK